MQAISTSWPECFIQNVQQVTAVLARSGHDQTDHVEHNAVGGTGLFAKHSQNAVCWATRRWRFGSGDPPAMVPKLGSHDNILSH